MQEFRSLLDNRDWYAYARWDTLNPDLFVIYGYLGIWKDNRHYDYQVSVSTPYIGIETQKSVAQKGLGTDEWQDSIFTPTGNFIREV